METWESARTSLSASPDRSVLANFLPKSTRLTRFQRDRLPFTPRPLVLTGKRRVRQTTVTEAAPLSQTALLTLDIDSLLDECFPILLTTSSPLQARELFPNALTPVLQDPERTPRPAHVNVFQDDDGSDPFGAPPSSARLQDACMAELPAFLSFPPPPPRATAPTRDLPPVPPTKDFPRRHQSDDQEQLLPSPPLGTYARAHAHSLSGSSSSSSADSEDSFRWSAASSSGRSSALTSPAMSSKSHSLLGDLGPAFGTRHRSGSTHSATSSSASPTSWQAFASPVWSSSPSLYSPSREADLDDASASVTADYLSLPTRASHGGRLRTASVASGQTTSSTITASSSTGARTLRGRKSLANIARMFHGLKKAPSSGVLRPHPPLPSAGKKVRPLPVAGWPEGRAASPA
jgi:hypothetical protein